MTWKQIETSREIRQWFKTITPIVGGAIYLDWKYPELKNLIAEKIKSKFKKEKRNEKQN